MNEICPYSKDGKCKSCKVIFVDCDGGNGSGLVDSTGFAHSINSKAERLQTKNLFAELILTE